MFFDVRVVAYDHLTLNSIQKSQWSKILTLLPCCDNISDNSERVYNGEFVQGTTNLRVLKYEEGLIIP